MLYRLKNAGRAALNPVTCCVSYVACCLLHVVCAARDGKSTRTLSYRQFALLATDTGLIDAKLPAKVLT